MKFFAIATGVFLIGLSGCVSRNSTVCSIPTQQSRLRSLPVGDGPCKRSRRTVEGNLEILAVDQASSESAAEYSLLADSGDRYVLEFASAAPELRTGDRVRVSGWFYPCLASGEVRTGSLLIIENPEIELHQLSASVAQTFGEQKTAVILIGFSDHPDTDSVSDARATVFDEVNRFYLENSYQQTWITGTVFGPYSSTLGSKLCDPDALASEAQALARESGADLDAFRRWIYVFPKNACGWYGLGTIGGSPSQAWINGSLELHTVAHELGHSLGLHHSNALSCDDSGCSRIAYGDLADAMGNGSAAHFNAFQKERLGWLSTEPASGPGTMTPLIEQVENSGRFHLEPYSRQSFGTKALKILQTEDPVGGSKTFYYVEYRTQEGFDLENLSPGILLHTGSTASADSSLLLHMNPLKSWLHAALDLGQQFLDAGAGTSISVLSADSEGASVEVLIDRPVRSPTISCIDGPNLRHR